MLFDILFQPKIDKKTYEFVVFCPSMYILAFYFFEKDDKYVFKARILCFVQKFLAFEYVFIIYFEKNQMVIYFCLSEI